MADEDQMDVEETEVVVDAGGEITLQDALKGVLKKALVHNGLRRGLHE